MRRSMTPWLVLAMTWLAFLLSYVDRFAWPPIMADVSRELGLTGVQSGSYMSAFFLGYVLTQLPAGFLIDRFGYRRVLLSCFALMGTFTALMSTVSTYEIGFLFRVLTGIGSGSVFAACVAAVCDWFEPDRRAFAMGLFQMGSSLGLVFANMFLPTISGIHGWRVAVVAAGAIPILCLLPAFFLLRSKSVPASTGMGFAPALRMAFGNRRVVLVAIIGFLALWATIGTGSWANAYMVRELGISPVRAGLFMSAYGLISIVSMPAMGWLADRHPRHRNHVLSAALLLFAALLFGFGLIRNAAYLPFVVPALGAFALGYYPVLSTMLAEAVDRRAIGLTTALANAIWQLGAFFSPVVVGLIVDRTHEFAWGFAALGAAPVLAVLVLWSTTSSRPSEAAVAE